MTISDERLAELIKLWERDTPWEGDLDTTKALRELQRLRREISQMTSLAGNALVQLHDAVTKGY